jgi:hypothetical protein
MRNENLVIWSSGYWVIDLVIGHDQLNEQLNG